MADNEPASYLHGLTKKTAAVLARANGPGISAMRTYLQSGEAVAFLGAGVSAPLYPLWSGAIAGLIDLAAERGLSAEVARTCRSIAAARPDSAVEALARALGTPQYQAILHDLFSSKRDAATGRTWTDLHELVCRCGFKAIATTNYDSGILDARMRVRPRARGTGFATWADDLELDRWRKEDIFAVDDDLPVLYVHGICSRPDTMVMATTEYRKAYAGRLAGVVGRMVDAWHLIWLGFSFADQRVKAILDEVAANSGPRIQPGAAPRHVAVMAWDPADQADPAVLADLAAIEYGADLGADGTATLELKPPFENPPGTGPILKASATYTAKMDKENFPFELGDIFSVLGGPFGFAISKSFDLVKDVLTRAGLPEQSITIPVEYHGSDVIVVRGHSTLQLFLAEVPDAYVDLVSCTGIDGPFTGTGGFSGTTTELLRLARLLKVYVPDSTAGATGKLSVTVNKGAKSQFVIMSGEGGKPFLDGVLTFFPDQPSTTKAVVLDYWTVGRPVGQLQMLVGGNPYILGDIVFPVLRVRSDPRCTAVKYGYDNT
jgi:hypothetical protein